MKGTPLSEPNSLSKPTRNSAALEIFVENESEVPLATARQITDPRIASALIEVAVAKKLTGVELDLTKTRRVLLEAADKIKGGDLSDVESMLYSQASALNLMFAEMSRMALSNIYNGQTFEGGKAYMGLALKAQNQSRMTLETLGNIKNPPIVYAKQANITNGPQQVNNGTAPRSPATEKEKPPSKVLEQIHEQRMDSGTQGKTDTGHSAVEAMATRNRP